MYQGVGLGTGTPVDMRDTCDELYYIAQRFSGGTQITNVAEAQEAGREVDRLLFLVEHAKSNGYTPYEIECAMKGELIVLA